MDAPLCIELVERRRIEYESYEPRFRKKAANSADSTLPWFEKLFSDSENVCLIAIEGDHVLGFAIARKFPTPPVYDPGGPTALIDDFCVGCKELWKDVGQALLNETKQLLKQRGFAQLVVVGARQDIAKTQFLEKANLSLASTWWTVGLQGAQGIDIDDR